MNCTNCGRQIREDISNCPHCSKSNQAKIYLDYLIIPLEFIFNKINKYGVVKRTLIYFFTFCFTLTILDRFVNRGIGLAIIVFTVAGYLFYKHYYRNHLINQYSREQNSVLVSLQHELTPTLSTYILAYTQHWSAWPDDTTIPDHDLPAIQLLIRNDTGKDFNISTLKKILDNELELQANQKFKDSFLQILKVDKRLPLNPQNACFLYEEIFGKNLTNLKHLQNILLSTGFQQISLESLSNKIESLYIAKSITTRANDIKSAVSNGATLTSLYSMSDLDNSDGISFEQFLKKLYLKMGFNVQTTKASGEQGADLLLEKYGRKIILQAKRYSHKVDNSAIQEAVAAKAYYNYDSAMVVTNSHFTNGAFALAAANNVELVDREKLESLLKSFPVSK